MKRTILLIIFVVIAAWLIGWGSWYANQLSEQSQAAATTATAPAPTQTSTSTNSTSTDMQTLQITDSVVGTGTVAAAGDTVSVLYTGTLDNGTVFDASSLHGNQPFSFVLGAGQVIAGWDQGVLGMKVGGTRELTIPSSLGYGAQSVGSIPPNSTLHFTVQLLSVSSTASTQ